MAEAITLKKERFYSLDVFRGATIALMIMVNNPGTWAHIYSPLKHASWHGLTPTDCVFPFFLFAVGNAFAFVMPRLRTKGDAAFWKKIVKRTILIFLIGLFLNWMPFFYWLDGSIVFKGWTFSSSNGEINGIRILGVLQRIAIAYFFASIIVYYLRRRYAFYTAVVILLGYWALTYFMNPGDPYSLTGWFGTAIDRSILSPVHMYHVSDMQGGRMAFDPEGLMSSFGPIAQVIFGYLCGYFIISRGRSHAMVNGVFVAGIIFLGIGYAWNLTFPINKQIWTSSYVIFTTGLAMSVLATMMYFIELKGKKNWLAKFFDVFGKNPLFIFVLSGVLPRALGLIRIANGTAQDGSILYTSPLGWFYQTICKPIFPNHLKMGSLLYAVIWIVVMWLIVYWMDKKKIYIKV